MYLNVNVAVSLQVLTGQVRLAVLLALCQSHVQRLASNDTIVHVRHGLGRFVRATEADEAKTFRSTVLHHHLQDITSTIDVKHVFLIFVTFFTFFNVFNFANVFSLFLFFCLTHLDLQDRAQ